MSVDDLSPSALPFSARVRHLAAEKTGVSIESAVTCFEYLDLAKRALLELRVREFTAGDVVALAAMMEQRERAFRVSAYDRQA